MVFVNPDVEPWLEKEIAQRVHYVSFLQFYDYVVKDHHGLLFPISSKGFCNCTGQYIPWTLLIQLWESGSVHYVGQMRGLNIPCAMSHSFSFTGARYSSVVRAFAHGMMGHRIDSSWGGPIELFLVPACAPQLV